MDECKPLHPGTTGDGGWDINIMISPRTAPWKFVPIFVYWAVFDTQDAADNARAIDVVNLARGLIETKHLMNGVHAHAFVSAFALTVSGIS
jgi:hypothetical protein